jgi:hypothetical protein
MFSSALTQSINEEALELYCSRFWAVLFERDEPSATLGEFCPASLEQYLHKIRFPFTKIANTGEDQFPSPNFFVIRRIASLSLMGSILDECIPSNNFEGICSVCDSVGRFLSSGLLISS